MNDTDPDYNSNDLYQSCELCYVMPSLLFGLALTLGMAAAACSAIRRRNRRRELAASLSQRKDLSDFWVMPDDEESQSKRAVQV